MRYQHHIPPTPSTIPSIPKEPTPCPTLHQSAVDPLAHDRIHDLYETASETRSDPDRLAADRPGLVTRTRWTVGRRLISLG